MLSAARVVRRRDVPMRARLADERGFTLIELLVAMVTGMVVMGGLYAVLEVSLHQSSRISDVVQASQLGRTAMTNIVDELHSACIAPGFAPVQEGSSASKLVFINGTSEKAELKEVRKDEIAFSGETLTDKVYLSNGGSWPSFTFPAIGSPTKSIAIATHVVESPGEGGKEPAIFRYYEYAVTPPKNSETEQASSTLVERPLAKGASLTAEQAQKVASVQVEFRAGAVSTNKEAARKVDLASQVTFAFSAPSAEASIEAAPCE